MIETNNVPLVNEQDKPIGEMEKLVAQYQDHLHRALSVYIFNEQGNFTLNKEQLKNITEQDYGQIPDVHIHNEGKGFGECKEKTATGNGNRL